jgi:hypothetical protein
MKYHEHCPEVKFGLNVFKYARLTKRQGHMLMTKFGKARKTGCSGFLFRIVQFQQFQNMNMTEAKLEDLKIQGVLKQGKGLKCIRGLR